ncbi:MAG TPA: indole-3-glycerol phosphate synthase TrpC [Gemmatimonadaceae bacterium]|nr:indole-3-glycerol phosphate synthase TrpC [Gemmatimonadaceae bacterium]
MQAFSAWAPPAGTLGRILGEAERRVEGLRRRRAELERAAAATVPGPSLAASLRRGDEVAVLAEVKRASPSKGAINPGLDAVAQARAYQVGGALGISVLTEPAHFGGSNEDLEAIRTAVDIPVLKKDFHVHPVQLVEARALGASAVLLIARALAPAGLRDLAAEAEALGLEVLVEVRDEWELERALETAARLVGVNNRNLETLAIDVSSSDRLIPAIPADRVAIAESGMRTEADVARAAAAGADAVLVGSSLSAASDPAAAVRALTGVPRGSR